MICDKHGAFTASTLLMEATWSVNDEHTVLYRKSPPAA